MSIESRTFFKIYDWRKITSAVFKLLLLIAFYLAGLLSANKTAIDQSSQINFLKSETERQQIEIDKFNESNELVTKLRQQVKELTEAIDSLQRYHGHEMDK